MDPPAIFSATLGLFPPWQVTSVCIEKDERRMDITVDYTDTGPFPCPHCGTDRSCGDARKTEIWFHSDFFRYATYLHARLPRGAGCGCGTERTVERPWCHDGSKFILLEEE